jgi:hypothetical protein
MKAYWGRSFTNPLILKFGARWQWMINWTPDRFNRGKELRLEWTPEPPWLFWRIDISFVRVGIRNRNWPAGGLATVPTELTRLISVSVVRVKWKSKVCPRRGHEGPEGEKRCSSTLSLTSALYWGGQSMPQPGRFTSGKDKRHRLYNGLDGSQVRSARVWKISPIPGFDPSTV